jgi:pyrroloquinoline quinone (PQQ) biosynthesis protein C
MIPTFYECEFCSSSFVNEKNLKKHRCKFMDRYEHVTQTKKGISAYNLYLKWLKAKGRSVKYIDEKTFIHSTQYNHFIKFIDFYRKHSIPDLNSFIKIMIKEDIYPQNWFKDKVLEFFLEKYDTDISPKKHISKTVETILRLCDGLECKPKELFIILSSSELFLLIKSRKLSPWLLLNSKEFKKFLIQRASANDRDYIQKYINPKKWKDIMKEHPIERKYIKIILEELGI